MEKEKIVEEMANILWHIPDGYSLNSYSDCKTIAEHLIADTGYRKASEVVAEVVTEIKNFITSEIAKREYKTEIEIKTQAKTLNRIWLTLDEIEKKYKGAE